MYKKFKECVEFIMEYKCHYKRGTDKKLRKWWSRYVGDPKVLERMPLSKRLEIVKEAVNEALSEWINSARYRVGFWCDPLKALQFIDCDARDLPKNYAEIVWEEENGEELLIEIHEGKIFVNGVYNRARFLKEFVRYLAEVGILPKTVLYPV